MFTWLYSLGNSIGWLANILQVATVVFSGYAAFRLWKQNRQLRDLARKTPPVENFQQLISLHEGVQTSAPVALAVSLVDTTHSIKPQVAQFLQAKGWSMPIEEVTLDGIKDTADLEKLIHQLREKRRYLASIDCTELHLFIQGPVQAGTIIGSLSPVDSSEALSQADSAAASGLRILDAVAVRLEVRSRKSEVSGPEVSGMGKKESYN